MLNRPELSVIQERVPPGDRERRHLHSKARQFFYVLHTCMAIARMFKSAHAQRVTRQRAAAELRRNTYKAVHDARV